MSNVKQYFKVLRWVLAGSPPPPPHLIKQRLILHAQSQFKPRIMVETGTLLGDMIEAMKHRFTRLYSIEISPELARKAQQRFAGDSHIQIIENDSAIALKELVPKLEEPALFWLDAHYSGGNTGKGIKETPSWENWTPSWPAIFPTSSWSMTLAASGPKKTIPVCLNWSPSSGHAVLARKYSPGTTVSISSRTNPDPHSTQRIPRRAAMSRKFFRKPLASILKRFFMLTSGGFSVGKAYGALFLFDWCHSLDKKLR
jgi:hypothetical protein